MNQLLLLPCNGGAKTADYLLPEFPKLGVLWKIFHKKLGGQVKFAAIDSIITLLNNDGLGAIVLYPEEMNRVKGYDTIATLGNWDINTEIGIKKFENHTECIKQGINRVFPQFDRIFVCLNLEVYKMCMYAAITETNQWHKVLWYDQLAAQFQYTKVSNEIVKDLNNSLVGIKQLAPKPIDPKYIMKWTKYREQVPQRWRYWEADRSLYV